MQKTSMQQLMKKHNQEITELKEQNLRSVAHMERALDSQVLLRAQQESIIEELRREKKELITAMTAMHNAAVSVAFGVETNVENHTVSKTVGSVKEVVMDKKINRKRNGVEAH
jgi:hypothetical protein